MKKSIKKEDTLYVVMPAYNEEETIEDVVKSWYPVLEFGSEKSRLVIADSGSEDNTNKILKGLKKKYPKLEIVSSTLKQHGPKLLYLYDYAIKNKADYVFQTDSDGQTNPKEFKKFWDLREKYDAILGSRPVRQDGKSRKVVEKTLCCILRVIFGVKVPDANCPFRLMKCDLVKKYLYNMKEDYNLPNVMLTTFYAKNKENIKFIDVTFKPRQGGVNSINIPKIVKIGFNALKDFYSFKKMMKSKKKTSIKDLLIKYKSFIFYAVFGVLTTLVNIAVFYVCRHIFNIGEVISNCIAWLLAVLFAYVTNRKWVFESEADTKKSIIKEIISFYSCRLATGALDIGFMYVTVDILLYNDMIMKVISNIIVIIINYIASKLIIFKKNKKIS